MFSRLNKIYLSLTITVVLLFFVFVNMVSAMAFSPSTSALIANAALEASASSGAAAELSKTCTEAAAKINGACLPVTSGMGVTTFNCTQAIIAHIKAEGYLEQCSNMLMTRNNEIQITADDLREAQKQTWKDSLAGAWKAMLSQFTEQLAYDTATWIASGGKGQQPLFITEGIGAYLKNTADDAVGSFIDEIDDSFGVDLCQPDFNIELAIKTGLAHPRGPRKPKCNFSKMVTNWRSAIDDASFSFEYNNYLRSSENDIGIYLTSKSSLMDKVKEATGVSALEANINDGFKDLKNLTGWVLTPGTMIKNQHEVANFNAAKQDTVFTGTIYDFIGTFLDTLVGKLLQNLQTGFFSDDSGSGSSGGFGLSDLSAISALLNEESSPFVDGSIGAEERFLNLIEGETTIGGPYNILTKLVSCDEASRINPKPTDCVIDPLLATSIREKRLVKQTGGILDRKFVPLTEDDDPQVAFTLRNVVILRKYRIVPVGWEIAARYIDKLGVNNSVEYSLGDIMNEFENSSSDFFGLVDPNWVLKAPELFCRREGFGAHNTQATSQDNSVRRSSYCADEQQCIKEDADGNCSAYGYCTEERKKWDLNSKTCQPRFNTCQVFQSRGGSTNAYLANTLDYGNCNTGNVGCRWYSTLYNPIDNYWRHVSPDRVLRVCENEQGCTAWAGEESVVQWKQVSNSYGIIMSEPCTQDDNCNFNGKLCSIPNGGVACALDTCFDDNILDGLNNGFEDYETADFDAEYWQEAYQNNNNRHFRTSSDSRTGNASLESVSFNNTSPLTTVLPTITVEPNRDYRLTFYARGSISEGILTVGVYSNESPLQMRGIGTFDESWQEYNVDFNTQNSTEIELRLVTGFGTVGAVNFDDFELKKIDEQCDDSNVWLTLGAESATDDEIYFDRDAQSCNANASGCTEFIRTRADLNDDLVPVIGTLPSEVNDNQLTYLKKAPDYFSCYETPSGEWPNNLITLQAVLDNRDASCANYSSVCIDSEMDCELYTPINGDPAVPGTVTSADLCPSECAGYQVYKQEETSFVPADYKQFINEDLNYCGVSSAGCDEFTNLDEVEEGGEALEYYTKFRVCQKPEDPDPASPDGRTYYTWEGSDITGYQLVSFDLKKSDENNAPCTNLKYNNSGVNSCDDGASGPATCTAAELDTNPDCREFYDTTGTTWYRLISKVIYVSDNCHPYRRTQTQIDPDPPVTPSQAQIDCGNTSGWWNDNNECIYMAIPGQGNTCSASAKGCREYTGNRGNSFINILYSDFENGVDSSGWVGGVDSSEATHPGGNSFKNIPTSETITRNTEKLIAIGNNKAYMLSFWAKGISSYVMGAIRFSGAVETTDYFADDYDMQITREWKLYEFGPVFVTWGMDDEYFSQNLIINLYPNNGSGNKEIYIDNIILKELPQSVYAIENSWFTPFACDNIFSQPKGDPTTPPDPSRDAYGEMLGCQQYYDRAGTDWYLRSFENLCRRDAVGCEQLIDTYNSNSPNTQTFTQGGGITVPADRLVYMVNDPIHGCNSDDKGCTSLGLPNINNYDEVIGYSTVYLKNQPDRYSTDLCDSSALWCDEFIGGSSVSYFKNPRDKLCEYRPSSVVSESKWFKKGTDDECDATYLQTFGTGAIKEKIQPIGWFNSYNPANPESWFLATNPPSTADYGGWVGSCPVNQGSCTEFIDPLTSIYKNEIINSEMIDEDNPPDGFPDRWYEGGGLWPYAQDLDLLTNTLYSFSFATGGDDVFLKLVCDDGSFVSPDNSLRVSTDLGSPVVNRHAPHSVSGRFYIISSTESRCNVVVLSRDVNTAPKVVQSGVYYSLANGVDYGSCNGLVDYNTGCVLFNDRSAVDYSANNVANRNSDYLTFDADATYKKQIADSLQLAVSPEGTEFNDSNIILNVNPDRECSSWLYCTTYEKNDPDDIDPIYGNNDKCLDLGLCTSVDESGVCNRFVAGGALGEIADYTVSDKNKTGYSFVGKDSLEIEGYYPYNRMAQTGNSGVLSNGNFESVVGNGLQPLSWSSIDGDSRKPFGWYDHKFSVIKDVNGSKEGARYLRLNSFYEAKSNEIDVFSNMDYVFSAWINTEGLEYEIDNLKVATVIQRRNFYDGDNGNDPWGIWVNLVHSGGGFPWQKKMVEFNASKPINDISPADIDNGITHDMDKNGNVTKVEIRLRNYIIGGETACNRYSPNFGCSLAGWSLFDDISIKPVLEVNDSDEEVDKYISRSCRIYPANDALSCQYIEGNKLFYGQYGYCLLTDPKNSKQCLQWWPVDQLQGELTGEIGGYSDRVPLDYCIDKQEITIQLDENSTLIDLSARASDEVGDLERAFDGDGNEVRFQEITIDDSYRPLFRFPYINTFSVRILGAGVSTDGNVYILIPSTRELMFDVNAGEWSSFAAFTPCINLEGIGVCFLAPTEWEIAANPIAYALATELNDLLDGMGGFGPNIGIKIVTDDDPDFGHMAIDPIPDLPGDILGVVWFVKKDVNEADVVAIDMKLSSEFEVSYCDKLTRTVTADGTNKAYASRVSRGSGFINTDGFKTYLYYKPFDFVDFFNAIIGNAPSLNDTTCIYQQNIDQVAGQCIDNHQPSVAVINSRCDYVRENYSECIHSCDDFEGSGFDTCTCDADDPNLTDPYDDSDVGPNEPQCNPRAAFDGDSCWDAYAEMISCEYLVNRAIRDVDRYFSGASPENECFKTAGCYDWDENFNTGHCEIDYADGQHNDLSPLADPVAVVNGTHAVFQLAITYLNGTPPPANILISPGEEKGCYEGAYYEYIKEADMCTRGTLEGICQAQSINTTNNLNPDCTADEKDTDIWGNPTGGYNHSDVKHHNMWEIAGPPAMTICENEPFVDFGYYSSDYQPFGAIVPPPGGQGPVDWTSREGLYKFPLFYEPPRMGGFDPPYQARMGEIHTEEGLEELFVRSYGIWEWNWNDVDNPTQGGDYVKDEGAIGLSIPGVVCNEDTRAESTNEPCFIHPDIDISTPNNITDGIGLVGLEFNTMVDPDQLPITAFEIHWGDGDTTKVSGVSLRNRSNDENPFLIYHLYDYWKTTRADADLLNTSCTVGYCDVGITVKIWDNWGKDGSDSTSFNLYK